MIEAKKHADNAPAQAILETVELIDADLIVLGAQHKPFADATVLGTTTERVIRFARKPVLAIVSGSVRSGTP